MGELKKFSEEFWTERYENGTTGWNIGYASTPIVEYAGQIADRELKILIPGAGNAYEAEHLHQLGFRNVFVLDISKTPLVNLAARFPDFPADHLIHQDFFEHTGNYDLIIEQTFFCALHPSQRRSYANKMFELLNQGGKLAGLWFNFPIKEGQDMPPFGGNANEYQDYFSQFTTCVFKPCNNSIPPRAGNELFGIIEK